MRTHLNARIFAVAAILVLALALLAVAPTEVEAKRLAAQKIGTLGYNVDGNLLKPSLQRSGVCSSLNGTINTHVFCNNNEPPRVVGNVDVVFGGWLEVSGTTLEFTGPHALQVSQGGKFTANSVTLKGAAYEGYQLVSLPNSELSLTNTQVTGAADFFVYSSGAQLHQLKYYSNDHGLVVSGDGTLIDGQSEFYDNKDFGIKVFGAGASRIFIRDSVVGSQTGTQNVGILLDRAQNIVIEDGNRIEYNNVGILLNNSLTNILRDNTIQNNTIAGVKQFIPYPEEGGSILDGVNYAPNALRGNTITGNGDGVVEYTIPLDVDAAQAQGIDYNTNYGVVTVDMPQQTIIENNVGAHVQDKILYLMSTRIGALIYAHGQEHRPTSPVYVAGCDGSIYDCDLADHSDARHYDNHALEYTRVRTHDKFFTSNLQTDNQLRTIRGVSTFFTPRFLMRDHGIDKNDVTTYYCLQSPGYPYSCGFRAVTIYEGSDYGRSSEPNLPRRQIGDQYFYYFFKDDERGEYALRFGLDMGKQPKPLEKTTSRRPAAKISVVPELRGVTAPPKHSDSN